jgi:PDZ domain
VTDYVITCTGPTDAGSRHVIAADGSYAFERLAPGTYHCIATADIGPAAGDAVLANAPVHLDLAIGAWGSIAGTVVDALTAAPLPTLKVAVMGNDTSSLEALLTGGGPTTDASGTFEIGKQSPGKSSLMIFDGGLTGIHPIAHRDFTLTAGQHLDLGAIKGVPPRTGAKGTLGLVVTGLKIDAVVAGGPAAKAGVKPGDVIAAVDGHTIDDLGADVAGELIDADHVTAGAVTKLRLTRGAGAIEISITADPA